MIRSRRLWIVVPLIVSLVGCTSGPAEEAAAPAEPDRASTPAGLPPAAVLVAHPIADYDVWKPVFDEFEATRREDGILGHALKRGLDDENVVYVYCAATDLARLQDHLDGSALAAAMERAGVQERPEVWVLKPASRNLVDRDDIPGIIVMHEVRDYDTWRAAYDAFQPVREAAGIVGHAVSQRIDDPNFVVVYHQARELEALRAFVESDELRGAMERAGVVGAPEIRFIRTVESAVY